MANYFKNSNLYAYDINYINPTIELHFNKSTDYNKLLKNNVNYYTYNNNNICYYRGDVFNVEELKYFQNKVLNNKIDILFSDAHHSYSGLISEYDNLPDMISRTYDLVIIYNNFNFY